MSSVEVVSASGHLYDTAWSSEWVGLDSLIEALWLERRYGM